MAIIIFGYGFLLLFSFYYLDPMTTMKIILFPFLLLFMNALYILYKRMHKAIKDMNINDTKKKYKALVDKIRTRKEYDYVIKYFSKQRSETKWYEIRKNNTIRYIQKQLKEKEKEIIRIEKLTKISEKNNIKL